MDAKLILLYTWLVKNSLKSEGLSLLKLASKKDDIIAQYPQYEDEINAAAQSNVRPAFYLWIVKQLLKDEPFEEIISMIQEFNRFSGRLPKKDLYQYKSLGELRSDIESMGTSETQERKKKRDDIEGTYEKIYQDDNVILIHPHSRGSSCHFGKGTRWCVSATESKNYFNSYSARGVYLYFILSKKPSLKRFSKIAFAFVKEDSKNHLEIFDAEDRKCTEEEIKKYYGKTYSMLMSKMTEHLKEQKETKFNEMAAGLTVKKYIDLTSEITDDKEINELEQDLLNSKATNSELLIYFLTQGRVSIYQVGTILKNSTSEIIKPYLGKILNLPVHYLYEVIFSIDDSDKFPKEFLDKATEKLYKLLDNDDIDVDQRVRYIEKLIASDKTPATLLTKIYNDWVSDHQLLLKENDEYFRKRNENNFLELITLFLIRQGPMPQEVLKSMLTLPYPHLKRNILTRRDLDPSFLEQSAEDENPHVRATVAVNDNTPLDTLKKLTTDSDKMVKNLAINVLKMRTDQREST